MASAQASPSLSSASLMERFDQLQALLDQKLEGVELVEKVRQATNLRRAHIGLGGIAFVILFIFFGFGAAFLTNLIALSFPVWASFKAIESVNAEDDKQWLMYWIIFGFVTLLESFVDFIVRYVPFYYSLKGAFFIYLQLPQFYGASMVYNRLLAPYLKKNESRIESTLSRVNEGIREVVTGTTAAAAAAAATTTVNDWDTSAEVDSATSRRSDAESKKST